MVVVSHHIGSPRHTTMNQKDRMTHVRLRMSEGFSTGGCLRVVVAAAGGLEVGMVFVGIVDFGESTSGVAPLAGGRRAAMLMMPVSSPFLALTADTLWCWRLGQRDAAAGGLEQFGVREHVQIETLQVDKRVCFACHLSAC